MSERISFDALYELMNQDERREWDAARRTMIRTIDQAEDEYEAFMVRLARDVMERSHAEIMAETESEQ